MSDVSSLRSERTQAQNDKASYENNQAVIEEQLERLRAAKEVVKTVQSEVSTLSKAVQNEKDQSDTWKGTEYSWYHSMVKDTFKTDYDTYYSSVDQLFDDICDKITQLENESSELTGLIGWPAGRINSLGNEIEKLLHW